jgi:hypothetical protein
MSIGLRKGSRRNVPALAKAAVGAQVFNTGYTEANFVDLFRNGTSWDDGSYQFAPALFPDLMDYPKILFEFDRPVGAAAVSAATLTLMFMDAERVESDNPVEVGVSVWDNGFFPPLSVDNRRGKWYVEVTSSNTTLTFMVSATPQHNEVVGAV